MSKTRPVKQESDPLEAAFERIEQQLASYTDEVSRLRAAQEAAAMAAQSTTKTLQGIIENLIKERTIQSEAVERLEKQKAHLMEEVARLSAERAELAAQAEAARQALSQAQEERQKLMAELYDLTEKIRKTKFHAAETEDKALAARLEMEQVDRALTTKKEMLAQLETTIGQLKAEVSVLQSELEQLRQEGRPLKPYKLPSRGLPRLALQPRKYGTVLTELDYRAMKRFQEAGGGDLATIVQMAVRNIIPHEFYEKALADIRAEIRQLMLESEAEIENEATLG